MSRARWLITLVMMACLARCGARTELAGDVNELTDASGDKTAITDASTPDRSPYCALHTGPATGCDASTPQDPIARCPDDTTCEFDWGKDGNWGCCKVVEHPHYLTCGYPGNPLDANICF